MYLLTKQYEVRDIMVNVQLPSRKVQARIDRKRTAGLCIIDGCENQGASRGPCRGCRQAQKNDIREGRTTEARLIETGELLPKQPAGRKPTSAYAKRRAAATAS